MRTEVRWLALGLAVVASASCYATYDRGVAAANAHDWPTAEAELWRYIRGSDCVGRAPLRTCKQAAVQLGEVLIEDNRPTAAAAVFRFARRVYGHKLLVTPDADRALDARIVKGYDTAKQRWDQFRSGQPGRCQIAARYRGPGNGRRLTSISAGLDMVRVGAAAGPTEPAILFETDAAAGPHAITLDATYDDTTKPGFHQTVETTYFRSCTDAERVELVFHVGARDPSDLTVDVAATGGKPVPREGPLRPHPGFPEP